MTTQYKIRTLNNHALHPETLMMGYGYSPALSEGSLKPPIFLTSTFVFESAQQGKDLFDVTAGRRQSRPGEKTGLVYSRFNNPNFEILEDRLPVWGEGGGAAGCARGVRWGAGPCSRAAWRRSPRCCGLSCARATRSCTVGRFTAAPRR